MNPNVHMAVVVGANDIAFLNGAAFLGFGIRRRTVSNAGLAYGEGDLAHHLRGAWTT